MGTLCEDRSIFVSTRTRNEAVTFKLGHGEMLHLLFLNTCFLLMNPMVVQSSRRLLNEKVTDFDIQGSSLFLFTLVLLLIIFVAL